MWLAHGGVEGRPWFRNLYAATDRYSGYATEPWPLLREAVEDASPDAPESLKRLDRATDLYVQLAAELATRVGALAAAK